MTKTQVMWTELDKSTACDLRQVPKARPEMLKGRSRDMLKGTTRDILGNLLGASETFWTLGTK